MTAGTSVRLRTNRPYLIWLASDTSKGLATNLLAFAVPLVALFITDDPAQAGMIGAVGMVTRLALTLVGGVLADRHSRLLLLLLGALIATVFAGGFTLLALGDALTFITLLCIEVLLMVRAGLFEPASESALKELVPDEAMGRAQSANQGRDAALQLAAGPLGGALLAAGTWVIGAVAAASYGLAAALAVVLRRTAWRSELVSDASSVSSHAQETKGRPNALRELREGIVWLFSRLDLSRVVVLVTVVNLGLNVAVTTVIYALQQNGYSTVTIGLISAGVGIMMLVGALIAPMLVPRIGAGKLTIIGLVALTAGTTAVVIAHEPWQLIIALGISVTLVPAVNAAMGGYAMVATPSRLLGRVNSVAGVLTMGAMPLAPLIAGFGLSLIGRTGTILIAAGLCAVSLLLALTNHALRAIPAEANWAEHARQFDQA